MTCATRKAFSGCGSRIGVTGTVGGSLQGVGQASKLTVCQPTVHGTRKLEVQNHRHHHRVPFTSQRPGMASFLAKIWLLLVLLAYARARIFSPVSRGITFSARSRVHDSLFAQSLLHLRGGGEGTEAGGGGETAGQEAETEDYIFSLDIGTFSYVLAASP